MRNRKCGILFRIFDVYIHLHLDLNQTKVNCIVRIKSNGLKYRSSGGNRQKSYATSSIEKCITVLKRL